MNEFEYGVVVVKGWGEERTMRNLSVYATSLPEAVEKATEEARQEGEEVMAIGLVE